MDVLFLGQAGVLINTRRGLIAIDPVASDMPRDRIVREAKGLKMILITHEHKEHFDPELVELLFREYRPYVVAPRPVLARLNIDVTYKSDVLIGDFFELQGFEIQVLRAFHPQSQYAVSYLIKDSRSVIYHAGDTYETDDMLKISGDLAIIPIRGMETMGAVQASRLAAKMDFRRVMPVYWSSKRDLDEFMYVTNDRVVIPEVGRWIRV